MSHCPTRAIAQRGASKAANENASRRVFFIKYIDTPEGEKARKNDEPAQSKVGVGKRWRQW